MNQALLVGINNYPPPNRLNGCINDVNDVAAELQNALGYSQSNITKMLDADATAANIKAALKAVVGKLGKGDKFLFWYSGHGAQLQDGNAATDVICPVDFAFTAATSVTVSDFHDIFSTIPKGVTAAWGSDSCHSGDLEKDFYKLGVPKQFWRDEKDVRSKSTSVKTFRDISAALPSIALMSGCLSSQTSADAYIDDRYNGAFTYYFLQTLKAPNGLAKPLVNLIPLVQAALAKARYFQTPQLSGPPTLIDKAFLSS